MKQKKNASQEPGELEVKLPDTPLTLGSDTGEPDNSYSVVNDFTENSGNNVRKSKILPNANRVVKMGAVYH